MSDSTTSKMSAESFSEMKMQAVQNDSGAVSLKAAPDGAAKYAVLNVEFKTSTARQSVLERMLTQSGKQTGDSGTISDEPDEWDLIHLEPNVVDKL